MKRFEFIEKMSGIDPKFVSEAANYRPKRANYIKVIAIAACLAMMLTTLTVWAFTLQTEKKSTFDIISELAETEDKTFTVSKYNQREIFSDVSAENLDQIFQALEIVISKNESLEFSNDLFFVQLFVRAGVEYEVTPLYVIGDDGYPDEVYGGGKVTVSTDQDPTVLKYAMLARIYLENFPDAAMFAISTRDAACLNWTTPDQNIILFFDYAEHGYKNVGEYAKACKADKSLQTTDGIYLMYSDDVDIFSRSAARADPKTQNLLEKYNPVSKRIQAALAREKESNAEK